MAKAAIPEDITKLDFETALQQLTTIVEQMEQGNLSLEQALFKFEQGVGLTRHCQQLLKQAEQKVQLVMQKDNGEIQVEPYQREDEA